MNWTKFDKLAAGALALAIAAGAYCDAARADGLPSSSKTAASILPVGDLSKAAPGTWSGIYIGAGFGYQIADTNLGLNADAPSFPFTGNLLEIDGLSGRGWTYDGRVGADLQIGGTPFVVGLLAGYKGGETEFSVSSGIPGVGNILNATLQQTWYAGGRVGFATGQSLFYAGYAWTQAEMDINIPAAPLLCSAPLPVGVSLNCNQDVDGRMFLAGIETKLSPQWALGFEYTLTQYDTATIFKATGGVNSISLDADTDVHAFMARLTFRPLAK